MNKLKCSGNECFNVTTFNIILVGEGLNEWPSGALVMKGLIFKTLHISWVAKG